MTAPRLPCPPARWPIFSCRLDEGLALPAGARAAWLAALAPDEQDLAPALARALAATPAAAATDADDFLHAPRLREPWDAHAAPPRTAGERVGAYELVEPLGRGGMGEVWRARRADGALQREVALKLPHGQRLSPAVRERFLRERDILASLDHPHIARLYDAGVDDTGRPFLAIEYVPGQPLDTWCRTRAPDLPTRLALLLQVADAVSYAHARLVLHRDLKPGNVIVGDDGRVRLLDFGIAKLMDGDHTADTALTQAFGRALTPRYASPEQVRGEPLGTASDVYSLGVLAYEMLTGRLPYRTPKGSAHELEAAILSAPVPPASRSAEGPALRQALAGDLDAILAKALEKWPADRYPTVHALAQDLRRHRDGQAVTARRDTRWRQALRAARRHRGMLAAGTAMMLALGLALGAGATTLVLVVLAAGLAAALWQARRARLGEARAAREARRAQAVTNCLLEVFDVGNGVIADGRNASEVSLLEALDIARERIDRRLRAQPALRAEVLQALSSVYEVLDRPDENFGLLDEALAALRDDPAPEPGQRATVLRRKVQAAFFHGRHDSIDADLQALDQAVADDEDTTSENAAGALYLRARWQGLRGGDMARCIALLQRAEALYAAHHPQALQRSHALQLLSRSLAAEAREAEALHTADTAVRLLDTAAPDDGMELPNALSIRGLMALGLAGAAAGGHRGEQAARARDDFARATALYQACVGADHFLTWQNEALRGHAEVLAGDVAGGLARAERAVEALAVKRPGQWTHLKGLERLGLARTDAGQWAGAVQALQAAWALVQASAPLVQHRAADVGVSLARALRLHGQPGPAAEMLAAVERLHPDGPPSSRVLRQRLAAERAAA